MPAFQTRNAVGQVSLALLHPEHLVLEAPEVVSGLEGTALWIHPRGPRIPQPACSAATPALLHGTEARMHGTAVNCHKCLKCPQRDPTVLTICVYWYPLGEDRGRLL